MNRMWPPKSLHKLTVRIKIIIMKSVKFSFHDKEQNTYEKVVYHPTGSRHDRRRRRL